MARTKKVENVKRGTLGFFPALVCRDGFTLWVMAGTGCASAPTENLPKLGDYEKVEITAASHWWDWPEETNMASTTGKSYVPLDKVKEIIEKHGGLK